MAPADTNSPYCTAVDAKKERSEQRRRAKEADWFGRREAGKIKSNIQEEKGERGEGSKDGNELNEKSRGKGRHEEAGGYKVT